MTYKLVFIPHRLLCRPETSRKYQPPISNAVFNIIFYVLHFAVVRPLDIVGHRQPALFSCPRRDQVTKAALPSAVPAEVESGRVFVRGLRHVPASLEQGQDVQRPHGDVCTLKRKIMFMNGQHCDNAETFTIGKSITIWLAFQAWIQLHNYIQKQIFSIVIFGKILPC